MSGGAPPNFGSSAQLQNILQSQISNYQGLYGGVNQQLMQDATNPNFVSNAQAQAQQNVQRSFQPAAAGLQHSLQQQGVVLTPQQQQISGQKMEIQNSLAQVDAMNRAGQNAYSTQTGIFTGQQSQVPNAGMGITG